MRTSRELSERVEIDFYRRPHGFRRVTWTTAAVLAVVSAAWLIAESYRGRTTVYQAGRLATPHRLFENDCEQCHKNKTWSPVRRLVSLDSSESSVSNEKCMTCHTGPAHHDNQVPAHETISCAKCHREHEGDKALAWVADRHCIECHGDLKTTHGPSETFVTTVTRFDPSSEEGSHPEFAVHRLLKSTSPETDVGHRHAARTVLDYVRRRGDTAARWQDQAQIRFNHAAHLKAERGEDGELRYGLIGRDGTFVDLSRSCESCHVPDVSRRYMKPIDYEKHCSECHPLYFDAERFPDQAVPHESPQVVRGFLTDFYTLRALQRPATATESGDQPGRKLPGRRYRNLLTKSQAEWLQTQLRRAEQRVQRHVHTLFGYEAQGGCRFCHTVTEPAEGTLWQIEPPNIPQRWYQHSEFRHDSHRMLACTECHRDFSKGLSIAESTSTGDVLLPPLKRCLTCHSGTRPPTASGTPWLGVREQNEQRSSDSSLGTARNHCVECHNYHNYEGEDFDGPLNARLHPIAGHVDKTEAAESSK